MRDRRDPQDETRLAFPPPLAEGSHETPAARRKPARLPRLRSVSTDSAETRVVPLDDLWAIVEKGRWAGAGAGAPEPLPMAPLPAPPQVEPSLFFPESTADPVLPPPVLPPVFHPPPPPPPPVPSATTTPPEPPMPPPAAMYAAPPPGSMPPCAAPAAPPPAPMPYPAPATSAPITSPPAPMPAASREEQAAPADRAGEVVVFFGCRGGAGSTTLATNLAGSLARSGRQVCIIDLDLQLGDVAVVLDIDDQNAATLAAVAREVEVLEEAVLKRRLARHESGLFVLAQGFQLEEVDGALPQRIPALLDLLRRYFDVIVVDGVRDFADVSLAALDAADQVILVTTQEVAAVRRATRAIEISRRLGYREQKLQVVVNRYQRSGVPIEEVERALGQGVAARVANDYKTAVRAQNQGALLSDVAARKRVSRDVGALARSITAVLRRRHEEGS
jgi:MinD-like ATPase involved in chromosome partitioning or flagellar assembly